MYTKGKASLCALAASLLIGLSSQHAGAQEVNEPVSQNMAPLLSPVESAALRTPDGQPLPTAFWWIGGALLILLLLTSLMTLALKAQVRRQTRHLQENEARLNTILDSVDACIYIKDTKLRYAYGNRQLCERFKRSPEDL